MNELNEKNKIKIQHKIKEEIKKTMSSIAEYKELSKPISPENAIGRVSRMDAINNKSVLDAALRKAKIKLEKLKIVKKEIENKDFGLCLKCKSKIPIERLMIVPESQKCIHCA